MKDRTARITGISIVAITGLLIAATAAWRVLRFSERHIDIDRSQYPVMGLDISSHNGLPDFDSIAAAGVRFVFLKASEGETFRDPAFLRNYAAARGAGIPVGAYHFFRFDRDGIEQAKNLLRVIGPRPLELGVAIDVEDQGNATGVPADSIKARLQLMIEYLNLRGHRVTLYSNRAGYEKYLLPDFEGSPLWICQFTDNSTNTDWTYWQFDHHGRIPGIRGDVDLNVFSGSRDDWERNWM